MDNHVLGHWCEITVSYIRSQGDSRPETWLRFWHRPVFGHYQIIDVARRLRFELGWR